MDAAKAAAFVNAIDEAIASGVLSVRHGDTVTVYRSLDEMQRARDMINRQAATTAPTRVRYPYQLRRGY